MPEVNEIRSKEEKLEGKHEFVLNDGTVSEMAELIRKMLGLSKKKKKEKGGGEEKKDNDIENVVSAFEQALNKWNEKFSGKEVTVTLEKKFRTYNIELVIPKTEAVDPFEDETHDEDPHYSELRRSLADDSTFVIYDYKCGGNTLGFSFRKPSKAFVPILVALGGAVILGLIFKFFFYDAGVWLSDQLIRPIGSKFISMLKMVATPMMFFLLISTICRLGTRKELGSLGKNLIRGIWFTLVITALAATVICAVLYGFRITGAETQSENQFAAIRDLIMDIIPVSVVDPFITGNALQIVFLAIVLGTAIFIRKTQNTELIILNSQIDKTLQMIMTVINSVMPVYVFLSIFALTITIDLELILSLIKLIILFLAVILLYIVYLIIKVFVATRRSDLKPGFALRSVFVPFWAAFTTASSLAAFQKSLKCSKEDFGIPEKETDFYMGTGRTIYKPASALNYIVIACFFAQLSGTVNMSLSWYITVFITCIILGVATPPITGGAKTCYTILFLQLGIPVEWLAVVISIDTLFDFFRTGSNVGGLQVELLAINERKKRKAAKREISGSENK